MDEMPDAVSHLMSVDFLPAEGLDVHYLFSWLIGRQILSQLSRLKAVAPGAPADGMQCRPALRALPVASIIRLYICPVGARGLWP